MPAIIDALKTEHRALAKVLKVLEEEMALFEEGEAPDYDLILMALDYCEDFPAKIHHPKEDLIYRRLVAARQDLAKDLDDLEAEHELIATEVAAFRQIVARVLEEEEVSREVFLSRGREMLSTYWTHMREEEDRFFPLCVRCLGEADWADISLEAPAVQDPVFTARLSKRFDNLRQRILAA